MAATAQRGKRWAVIGSALALIGALAATVTMLPVARGDGEPRVAFTTVGLAPGSPGGAINRFTIRFTEPMVALGDPRAPAPATSSCPVPSAGRWTDPQTWVLEFEHPLPGGVVCTVDLRDDVASARGITLAGAKRFKIDTGGPTIRDNYPSGDIDERQVFLISTNVPATPQSIAAHAYCAVDGVGERIAVDVLPLSRKVEVLKAVSKDSYVQYFLEDIGLSATLPDNAAERERALAPLVALSCRRPLPPGAHVAVVWGKGIASASGRVTTEDVRLDFSVRDSFSAKFMCDRVNARAGCDPVVPAKVQFSAEVPRAMAMGARLRFADGTERAPEGKSKNGTLDEISFAAPFPEAADAQLVMPAGLTDYSGRTLSNAARFPLAVHFDAAPPLIKFAAPFGILEAVQGGVLPVTVRAVESSVPQRREAIAGARLKVEGSDFEIAQWLRKVDVAQENDIREEKIPGTKDETRSVNYTGTQSILNGQGTGVSFQPPEGGKAFEVVGIPLKEKGFYVVEMASPALGAALLGRPATRYVSAAVLVTDMTVHFKWGRDQSLVWVTTLDGATPVDGADIVISNFCNGAVLARGRTSAGGRLVVPAGLVDPNGTSECPSENAEESGKPYDFPLMVSARRGDDFSFDLTQWHDGISPWDFDLNYGWSESGELFHSIFDRSLARQGDTVHMRHILRQPVANGFAIPAAVKGMLQLSHQGSGTSYEIPVSFDAAGNAMSEWAVPKSAPMGDYQLSFSSGDQTLSSEQTIRVDAFRLPTMRATIEGPRMPPVAPKSLPLSLFVGYLSGGGAAGLPVTLVSQFSFARSTPDDWEGWFFGGEPVEVGTFALDDDRARPEAPLPLSQTLPLDLGKDGTANATLDLNQTINRPVSMAVEMDYPDANGETLTARRQIMLYPAALQVGLKTDGWLMRDSDLRVRLVVLDLDGKPMKNRAVSLNLYSREILSTRRRLIGGFYAYDNNEVVSKLDAECSATTDDKGLAECTLDPGVSGEVTMVATAKDDEGRASIASASVWLIGEDEWWFGGDNGDRMDVIPEKTSYGPNETARFQVRMPFRKATALVTVEREGVLSSFVTELSGKDPVVEVPMAGSYAPDVYVSVMAVRGRVGGYRLWLADLAKKWNLPLIGGEGASPTATVDLAKPSFRLGTAHIRVGWDAHKLKVAVKADRQRYAVRDTAQVDVTVTRPDGSPAASADVTFVAVDEALLILSPNDSWKLLDAMMDERPINVLTSTAQMQVVGKRHYGRKALAAGGGGGDSSGATRDDFEPVLLWKGTVPLDSRGHARVPVPLSDSLSSFRLVAIASDGAQLFGSGEASVRTAQDLTLYSGLPPVVRAGDRFGANFILRNGSDKPITVEANATLSPAIARGETLKVTVPANSAVPLTWNMTAPAAPASLKWTVDVKGGKASDRLSVTQTIEPLVPVEVWAATMINIGGGKTIPVAPPTGALAGGSVDVRLSDTLAPPMAGVIAYMTAYPYNCFEQQTSRIVALEDRARWTALMGEAPGYLDGDGLLRYFPNDNLKGSPILTAYVLSIAQAADLPIPGDVRGRMIEAMRKVVKGTIDPEVRGGGNRHLIKIAALAALARQGESTPDLLGAIDLSPTDMPTASLIDWIVAVDRTRGLGDAGARRAAAEAVLRQRLVFEGTRVDFTDSSSTPMWLFSTGDETAVRLLELVLGRPGWDQDAPRLMIAAAARQQRGHWDTTMANAWGRVAVNRFAALYPASAIAGVTTVSLGPVTRSQSWPMAANAAPLRLPLVAGDLLLRQQGGMGPWAQVMIRAAVPLLQPLSAGYRLSKSVEAVTRKNAGHWTRGDVVRVTLTVQSAAERQWVVIADPLPPGATVVGDLGGQSARLTEGESDAEAGTPPSYVERGPSAWRGYYEWMPAGTITVRYTMRLNGSGNFSLPPSRVEAMYAPAIRAQLPNAPMSVDPR